LEANNVKVIENDGAALGGDAEEGVWQEEEQSKQLIF